LAVAPAIAGAKMALKRGVNAGVPASTEGSPARSFSAGGLVGRDEGRTGTPGGDCAPGTPGKENRPLTEGNEVGEENGADCSGLADGTSGSLGAEGATEAGDPVGTVGPGARNAGIVPGPPCVVGIAGGTVGGWGPPGTDIPGTRGKENISVAPGIVGAATHGSFLDGPVFEPSRAVADDPAVVGETGIPGDPAAAGAGEAESATRSAPLGGAVGGEEGKAGTPGREYISVAGGIRGAAAQGPPFSPTRKWDDEAGHPGC